MGDDQAPHAQQDEPRNRWGDPISEERQAELLGVLAAWDAPDADHSGRMGPFDGGPDNPGEYLTGADVSWLANLVRSDDGLVHNLHLEGAYLLGANLAGASLSYAHLEEARLGSAQLERAYLAGAHLEQTNLAGAQLKGANFSGANLTGSYLRGAQLEGADLRGAQLEGADLEEADLRSALFRTANLKSANLHNAQLEGASLLSAQLEGADLRGAHLEGVELASAWLEGVYLRGAHLERANFGGAHLQGATLRGAHLQGATLRGAHLEGADLVLAHLERATLRGAHLQGATLRGAHLEGADLNDAHLEGRDYEASDPDYWRIRQSVADFPATLMPADIRRTVLDAATSLNDITLGDARGGSVRMADIRWGGTNLAVVDWTPLIEPMAQLGDERAAREWKPEPLKPPEGKPSRHELRAARSLHKAEQTRARLEVFRAAVRANRQLVIALRNQGMNEEADQFAYRAQVIQRQVFRQQHKRGRALLWWFLDRVAGHGYRPARSMYTYVGMILVFAVLYLLAGNGLLAFGLAGSQYHSLPWYEALILSVSSFHGRGFFQPLQSPGDPVAIIASVEAIFGLFIEVSFIATFTQRFFGK
jgi:uncharacterized protein YjbI with pentapeptide repeats